MARGKFRSFFILSLLVGAGALIALAVFARDAGTPATATAATASEDVAPTTAGSTRRATPVSVRGGLPNVAAKLRDKKDITIVFLGGGVTAGGGGRSYGEQIGYWLRSQNPSTRIRTVNAGIHRSNSEFGAARFDRDVLSAKPDLVFIDFVADNAGAGVPTRNAELMQRDFERIVRKGWTADPTIDFVFVATMAESVQVTWKRGMLPPAAAAQERVAEHYGIPSIALAMAATDAMEKQNTAWGDVFVDEITPTPRGHAIYAEMVTNAMPELLAAGKPGPHVFADIKPLVKNFWLYPKPLKALPQPAAPAMELVDGAKASRTWDMPVVGVHWIGEPVFVDPSVKPVDGKTPHVLWRLRSQSTRDNGRRLNEVFSLDRTKWGPPMQWFEEYRCFHGPSGLPLIETQDKELHHLEARGNDLPIVSFIAPSDGKYVYSVRAEDVLWWGSNTAIAMNVVRFRNDEPRGESVGIHRSEEGLLRRPEVAGEVILKAGDEIAFCVDTNSSMSGGGASYLNTLISVGYFGAK